MRAVFTTAIRYKVNAVCETPLRTGGAAGNTESVLRDSFGNAFLQGSSWPALYATGSKITVNKRLPKRYLAVRSMRAA